MSNPNKQDNPISAFLASLLSGIAWIVSLFLILIVAFKLNDEIKKSSNGKYDLSHVIVYGLIAMFVLGLIMAAFGPLPDHIK